MSPRSLGRSVRHRFGARHHNIYTAKCCFGCHSTKAASWGPPLRRASIGSVGMVSHALARSYWTTDLSITFKAARPPRVSMNGRTGSHSWTAVIHPPPHTYTHPPHTYTHPPHTHIHPRTHAPTRAYTHSHLSHSGMLQDSCQIKKQRTTNAGFCELMNKEKTF